MTLLFVVSSTLLQFSGCTSADTNTENAIDVNTPRETPISIVTWNVHNLFDTVCDSGACGNTDYEKVYTANYYKGKLSTTASGLRMLNADIVMLQEIEKESCLTDLLNQYLKQYPYYVFGEHGSTATVDVALISKWPLKNIQFHRNNTSFTTVNGDVKKLARELIQATAVLESGEEITIFTTHFISKASDEEGIRRNEEGKLVNQIISEFEAAHPNAKIAFGGDLNDDPDSVALANLAADGVLINSTAGAPVETIYTWGGTSAFDHIFHNPALAQFHEKTEVFCTNGQTYLEGSDHCAVKANYKIIEQAN